MKFDFSYIDLVYDIMDGKKDTELLTKTTAYKSIKAHGEKTFGGYDAILKAISSIQNGNPNNLASYLLSNKDKIYSIISTFSKNEDKFKDIIMKNVLELYPDADFSGITIYFIVGYDAIGYNGNVICSIEFDFILNDYRELISLLTHETAHIIYFQHFPEAAIINLERPHIKYMLNMSIQSEGIAIFSAYRYRNDTGIISNKSKSMLQDYENNPQKEKLLRDAYKKTMKYIDEGIDMDTILSTYFDVRVDHALGFIIFENEYKKHGINAIRKMCLMENDEFIKLFLK